MPDGEFTLALANSSKRTRMLIHTDDTCMNDIHIQSYSFPINLNLSMKEQNLEKKNEINPETRSQTLIYIHTIHTLHTIQKKQKKNHKKGLVTRMVQTAYQGLLTLSLQEMTSMREEVEHNIKYIHTPNIIAYPPIEEPRLF